VTSHCNKSIFLPNHSRAPFGAWQTKWGIAVVGSRKESSGLSDEETGPEMARGNVVCMRGIVGHMKL
jgi:hypothetical protein